MGKFRQILTALSARYTPYFCFLDDNLSKCQGILTNFQTGYKHSYEGNLDCDCLWANFVNVSQSYLFVSSISFVHFNKDF